MGIPLPGTGLVMVMSVQGGVHINTPCVRECVWVCVTAGTGWKPECYHVSTSGNWGALCPPLMDSFSLKPCNFKHRLNVMGAQAKSLLDLGEP